MQYCDFSSLLSILYDYLDRGLQGLFRKCQSDQHVINKFDGHWETLKFDAMISKLDVTFRPQHNAEYT